MKRYINPNLNSSRCNAYSGTAYLYAAISTENRLIIAKGMEGAPNREVPDDRKGGIIVFPREAGDIPFFENQLMNHFNQGVSCFPNKTGWTIGRFLKGNYPGPNGIAYSEESLSVEITGVSDDALVNISEELCEIFALKNVLVKAYSERNCVFFVDGE